MLQTESLEIRMVISIIYLDNYLDNFFPSGMKPVSVKKSFILVKTSDIDLRDVNRLNARQIPVKIFEIFGLKIFEIFGLKIFENC